MGYLDFPKECVVLVQPQKYLFLVEGTFMVHSLRVNVRNLIISNEHDIIDMVSLLASLDSSDSQNAEYLIFKVLQD